jgi:hypothetical protein
MFQYAGSEGRHEGVSGKEETDVYRKIKVQRSMFKVLNLEHRTFFYVYQILYQCELPASQINEIT